MFHNNLRYCSAHDLVKSFESESLSAETYNSRLVEVMIRMERDRIMTDTLKYRNPTDEEFLLRGFYDGIYSGFLD